MRAVDLPVNAWGDATFHLANAARALEAAAHEAITRSVALASACRADQQEAMRP